MLATILRGVLTSLLTKKFIIRLFIVLAEWLAARSDNKLDDEVVKLLKENLEV